MFVERKNLQRLHISLEILYTSLEQGCRGQLPGYPGTYPPGLGFLGKKPGFRVFQEKKLCFYPKIVFFFMFAIFLESYTYSCSISITSEKLLSQCQKEVKYSNIHHFTKWTNELYKILKTLIYYLLSLSQQMFCTKLTNI